MRLALSFEDTEDDIEVVRYGFDEGVELKPACGGLGNPLNRLVRRMPSDTRVFPFDLRWASVDGRAAIFEVPPRQQMVTFTNTTAYAAAKGLRKVHTLFINVPRTVIGVAMNDFSPTMVYNFITLRPIQSWRDGLYLCVMPNVYNDGHICLPSEGRRFDQESFTDGLLSAYEAVWDTRYNTDLIEVIKYVRSGKPEVLWNRMVEQYRRVSRSPDKERRVPRGTPLQLLHQWQKLSMDEAMAIHDWPTCEIATAAHLRDSLMKWTKAHNNQFTTSVLEAVR